MPRLIEIENAIRVVDRYISNDDTNLNIKLAITNIPTVDAESVRHGHWIEKSKVYPDFPYDSTYNYECSNCGYTDTHGADVEVPYCWHCGAKMDAPTQKSVGNALEALDRWKKEPEINPCRGCEDYDGKGGCLSHGGCGEGREDG